MTEPAFDDDGQPVGTTEIDFSAMDARLAGEPDHSPDPAQPELRNLEAWLCSPRGRDFFGVAITRKLAALNWLVRGEKPLAELAAELGCSKSAVAKHAAEASRIFGLRNRAQIAHGGRLKKRGPQKVDARHMVEYGKSQIRITVGDAGENSTSA